MQLWRTENPIMNNKRVITKGGMFQHQRDWWDSAAFIKALVTGYGGGKTIVGAKRSIALALHNAPQINRGEYCPHLIVSPSYKIAKRTVIPTLKTLLNGKASILKGFKYLQSKTDHSFTIWYQGREALIWIGSGDDPESLKGPNIGSALIDEPFVQSDEVLDQVLARVRHPLAKKLEIGLTGCVTRGSIVLTKKGFLEIGSFDPGTKAKEYKKIKTNVFGDSGFQRATKFYNNGIDDCVKLILSKGFDLTSTPDHPVMTMGNNLEIEYKRVGNRRGKYGHLEQLDLETDRVAVARGMEVWGNKETVSKDDAYSLGVWIAEGSCTDSRITITCGDRKVLKHFRVKGLFGELFNNPSGRVDQVRLYSSRVVKKLRDIGVDLVRSPFRSIPDLFMARTTREITLHFLAGMYDGDGHVCENGNGGVGYTTTSHKMAKQLQVLLTNFGVCADLVRSVTPPTKRVKVSSERWQLLAKGQNGKILASILPLRIGRKRRALKLYENKEYRDSDIIPNVGSYVLELWENRGKERWRNNPNNLISGYRICESIRQGNGADVSYSYVKWFCELYRLNEKLIPKEIRQLEELLRLGHFWAGVRSLEVGLRRTTVDFVIPKSHSFTPNGIFSLQTPEELNWGYDICEGERKEDYEVYTVHASTRENLALAPEYANRMERAYTDLAAQAFVDGKFTLLTIGLVYYGFSDNNILDIEDPGLELLVGMDFNVNPMAAIVFWVHGNHMHVIDEIELPNSDTQYMCDHLKSTYLDSSGQCRISTIYPDSSGANRSTKSPGGKSDFYYIKQAGFAIEAPSANPHIKDRENAVNGKLNSRASVEPTLTISPKCKKLISYCKKYQHEKKNKQKDMSHLIDAFGYPVHRLFPIVKQSFELVRIHGA